LPDHDIGHSYSPSRVSFLATPILVPNVGIEVEAGIVLEEALDVVTFPARRFGTRARNDPTLA
jgi:hypothetical protein